MSTAKKTGRSLSKSETLIPAHLVGPIGNVPIEYPPDHGNQLSMAKVSGSVEIIIVACIITHIVYDTVIFLARTARTAHNYNYNKMIPPDDRINLGLLIISTLDFYNFYRRGGPRHRI